MLWSPPCTVVEFWRVTEAVACAILLHHPPKRGVAMERGCEHETEECLVNCYEHRGRKQLDKAASGTQV